MRDTTKPIFELVGCLWSFRDLGLSKVFDEDFKNIKPTKLVKLNNNTKTVMPHMILTVGDFRDGLHAINLKLETLQKNIYFLKEYVSFP